MKIHVYTWEGNLGRKGSREVVAAHSIAEALRCADVARKSALFNFAETQYSEYVAIAMTDPGAVFWRPIDARTDGWTRWVRPLVAAAELIAKSVNSGEPVHAMWTAPLSDALTFLSTSWNANDYHDATFTSSKAPRWTIHLHPASPE